MSRYAAEEGRLVYVGNLPDDVRERDLQDIFAKYGRIRSIDIKQPPRPPPFAFVEFDDRRDAEDAVRARDGYDLLGSRLRVEMAKGSRSRGGPSGKSREFRPPNTGHRVIVKGLPPSASWQDLKDFLRQVVRPAYTNIEKDRDGVIGVAEFESFDDMDRVIRKLDDTEFENMFGRSFVRIYEDSSSHGKRGRSRSRSMDRGRGRGGKGWGGRGSPSRGYGRPRRSFSRSPMGRGRSPPSPRGRSSYSPRGRSPPSPRGRSSLSPRGRSSRSPPGRGRSPPSPRDRSPRPRSPSRSPSRGRDDYDDRRRDESDRQMDRDGPSDRDMDRREPSEERNDRGDDE